ncbi:unnamed protein product [Diplocarpon coronariae]
MGNQSSSAAQYLVDETCDVVSGSTLRSSQAPEETRIRFWPLLDLGRPMSTASQDTGPDIREDTVASGGIGKEMQGLEYSGVVYGDPQLRVHKSAAGSAGLSATFHFVNAGDCFNDLVGAASTAFQQEAGLQAKASKIQLLAGGPELRRGNLFGSSRASSFLLPPQTRPRPRDKQSWGVGQDTCLISYAVRGGLDEHPDTAIFEQTPDNAEETLSPAAAAGNGAWSRDPAIFSRGIDLTASLHCRCALLGLRSCTPDGAGSPYELRMRSSENEWWLGCAGPWRSCGASFPIPRDRIINMSSRCSQEGGGRDINRRRGDPLVPLIFLSPGAREEALSADGFIM